MSGRPGIAPCGHPGEYVIGTFVNCRVPGCDGLPPLEFDIEEDTPVIGRCPKCGSLDTAPFHHPWFGANSGNRHCRPCGAVF